MSQEHHMNPKRPSHPPPRRRHSSSNTLAAQRPPHRHEPEPELDEHGRPSPFKTASARLLREHMDQIEAAVLDAGYASVAAFVNKCFLDGYAALGYEHEAAEIRRHYGSPRRNDRLTARELVKKLSASVYSQEDPDALRRLERVITAALDGEPEQERPTRKRSGEHLTPRAFEAAKKLPSTAPPKRHR